MSEPFLGEMRMFAGNFAPRNWAFCDGQLLAVSQHDALFSLFGTIYGGDGETTFGLPDMRGRVPVHAGSGPGLSPRRLGGMGGVEKVTLTVNQLPSHGHGAVLQGATDRADSTTGGYPANSGGIDIYTTDREAANTITMIGGSTSSTGGSRSHSNLMPFLCINFIVALIGIYPSRH